VDTKIPFFATGLQKLRFYCQWVKILLIQECHPQNFLRHRWYTYVVVGGGGGGGGGGELYVSLRNVFKYRVLKKGVKPPKRGSKEGNGKENIYFKRKRETSKGYHFCRMCKEIRLQVVFCLFVFFFHARNYSVCQPKFCPYDYSSAAIIIYLSVIIRKIHINLHRHEFYLYCTRMYLTALCLTLIGYIYIKFCWKIKSLICHTSHK
jgi:hypothetical protein